MCGISGLISSLDGKFLFAYFGQIHPRITPLSYGFEIFLDNLVNFKSVNKKNKGSLLLSEYQKSERDFAFLVNKKTLLIHLLVFDTLNYQLETVHKIQLVCWV